MLCVVYSKKFRITVAYEVIDIIEYTTYGDNIVQQLGIQSAAFYSCKQIVFR